MCLAKGGIEITYEDLRDKTDDAFDRVVSFLGAGDAGTVWPQFLSSSESADATKIINLDAVATVLRDRGSEWMLGPFLK